MTLYWDEGPGKKTPELRSSESEWSRSMKVMTYEQETLELRSGTEAKAEFWITSAKYQVLGPVDLLCVNASDRRWQQSVFFSAPTMDHRLPIAPELLS